MNSDPLWYKDAVIYEIHVKSFYDSNGDGIGDFQGLIEKLDYLQNLGITCIWLLPFFQSPLRDDGYDISDYKTILPEYGTMDDFRRFVEEAHKRNIRVLIELVLNHTSDKHPWFLEARSSKDSPKRNYYVWSDDPNKYQGVRIIFSDFEKSNWTFDPVTGQYYWHRFFSHQPDLNYDNPEVGKEMFEILSYWLKTGVDGFRLDAVPYLFEREGTDCHNLPETHAYLKQLRAELENHFKDRIFLAEANQPPEDVLTYFGNGDECHMAFHFPLMPRIFLAIRREDKSPILETMRQTPPIPESCQWAVFLRNHDELTLEKVTPEEREYMYQEYAIDPKAKLNLGIRRRLAPLMNNGRRQKELLNSLLLSLPGSPVIYYGDELGMGDNIHLLDRHGVRTPMQWSGERNGGFSTADPSRLCAPLIADPVYGYQLINADAQSRTPTSFLNWTKRLIQVRKNFKAFGRGDIRFIETPNKAVLAYIRSYENETLLIANNLSRYVQPAEFDLSAYKEKVPIELIGNIKFPRIGQLPYFLTFGPHGFYWFRLT